MPTHQVIPADEWATWPDDQLLDLRMCQLGVDHRGQRASSPASPSSTRSSRREA